MARPPVPPGPYLVLGLGAAGQSAAQALAARFGAAVIRGYDDSSSDRLRPVRASLASAGIATPTDPAGLLDGVGCIVKSPGIDPGHPLLSEARRQAVPVLDELELGWRMSAAPIVAVTGTNGKSTTSALIVAALEAAGANPALCGNSHHAPALTAVAPEHDGWLVAEVSSYQAEGCPEFLPSAAVFTNLTLDHLQHHGSMTAYAEAKRRYFVRGDRAVALAVLNADDAFGRRLVAEVCERDGRVITYGAAEQAEYRIVDCAWSLRGGRVVIDAPSGRLRLVTRLPGAYNAANVAAALALADGLDLPATATLEALATAKAPPGRFEVIDAGQPFDVVVDFAHSPDSVRQVIATLRSITAGRGTRTIVVLGATTTGTRQSREEIGREARAAADYLVLSAASSRRGHPPMVALSWILTGARKTDGAELEVVLSRTAAIARGFEVAQPGDVVAILGRGPLAKIAYDQVNRVRHFDDRETARELLHSRADRA